MDLGVLGAHLPPKAPGTNRSCFVRAALELKQSTDTKTSISQLHLHFHSTDLFIPMFHTSLISEKGLFSIRWEIPQPAVKLHLPSTFVV